jgi:eukaryotic-like serine/threonine-protein kinase
LTPNHQSALSQSTPPDAVLDAVVEEFVSLLERGAEPSIDEFLSRHPEHAEVLRDLLAAAKAMASLGRSGTSREPPAGKRRTVAALMPEFGELGDFRLVRELGRGGMGVVYEAEQISLGRRIALKVLPFAAFLDPRHLQRFKNEARAAATLDHPHIVHVHSVGQDRGVHFYAMQLIEGQSLAEVIEALRHGTGQIEPAAPTLMDAVAKSDLREEVVQGDEDFVVSHEPWRSQPSTLRNNKLSTMSMQSGRDYYRLVARWCVQAAEALEHAHQLGIVHRDIKPSNLLVNPEGRLWVTDFGLAMTHADNSLTMTGDVLGTLRYMSPEQALGKRGVVDQRSDVYSLGATLYELLTLQPAFPEADRTELLRQIEQDDPPSMRQAVAGIPIELETIACKALRKDPAARYATAGEFAEDLQRFLSDQPIRARPPSWRERVTKWSRRHRTLARSLMLVASVSLVMTFIAVLLVVQARQQTEIERMARHVETVAAEIGRKNVRMQQYVTRVNLADRALLRGDLQEARIQLKDCVPHSGQEDLRGLEWSYLSRRTAPRLRKIGQHTGPAYHVQASPRGNVLASCGQDGIRIWDLQTGQLRRHLTAHQGDVNAVGFSPDGRLMVSAGDDDIAIVWDTNSWTQLQTLRHTGRVIGGHFTPDGRWLFTCGRSEDLAPGEPTGENVGHIWDVQSWKPVAVLQGHQDRIAEVALSSDGRRCVTADRLGVVNVWSVPEGSLQSTVRHWPDGPDWGGKVLAVACARQHPWMVTTGLAGSIHLWSIHDGAPIARLRTLPADVRSVAFSPDDRYLLTGGTEGVFGLVRAWMPLANGELREAHSIRVDRTVWWLSFLNQDEVAIADDGGAIYRWTMVDESNQRRFSAIAADTVAQAAISPDGRWLASSSSGLTVRALDGPDDPASGGRVFVLDPESPSDTPVEFSACGQYLAGVGRSGCTVWSTSHWQPLKTFSPIATPIHRLRFEQNGGELIAIESDRPSFHQFDVASGTLLPRRDQDVFRFSESSSGLSLTVDPFSGLWEVRENDRPLWSRVVARYYPSIACSKDSMRLAYAQREGGIEILDATSGTVEAVCFTPGGLTRGLAFSPDGRTLAAWHEPQLQVMFWHVATGRELFTISPGLRAIRTLAFTPDGAWLVLAGQNLAGHAEVQLLRCGPTR